MNFQDLWNKFHFIFEQLCDAKTCALIVMGIGKRLCELEVGWTEVIKQCVFVGQRMGWMGIIRHQMLL